MIGVYANRSILSKCQLQYSSVHACAGAGVVVGNLTNYHFFKRVVYNMGIVYVRMYVCVGIYVYVCVQHCER